MTPTEALATALDGMTVPVQPERCEPLARAFLAALPPGWRLCGPDDVTVTVDGLAEALLKTQWWDHALLTEEWSSGELAAAILAALSADTTPSPSADRPHDPNSGPGSDWCPECRQYEPDR